MAQTITSGEVQQFLSSVFNPLAEQVIWIASGWFSQVFSFKVRETDYIIRLNPYEEDFQKDAFAYQHFARPGLPVPRILQIGQFDRRYCFAISERCPGKALADFEDDIVRQMVPALFETLDTIHRVDVSGFEGWGLRGGDGQGLFGSWPEYLLSLYNQKFIFDWQALARNTFLERDVFESAFMVFQNLISYCSSEKSLLHGDFGPHNLVSDGKVITGVLDWADSRLGDYLYDVAYLDYSSEDIFYIELWQQHTARQGRNEPHFEERIMCYKLHNILNDLAISAIQNKIGYYKRVKKRLHAMIK